MCSINSFSITMILTYSRCMTAWYILCALTNSEYISFSPISFSQIHIHISLSALHTVLCVESVSLNGMFSHVKEKRLSFCEALAEDLLHTSTPALAKMESGYSFHLGVSGWELKRWNTVRQCPLAAVGGSPAVWEPGLDLPLQNFNRNQAWKGEFFKGFIKCDQPASAVTHVIQATVMTPSKGCPRGGGRQGGPHALRSFPPLPWRTAGPAQQEAHGPALKNNTFVIPCVWDGAWFADGIERATVAISGWTETWERDGESGLWTNAKISSSITETSCPGSSGWLPWISCLWGKAVAF